MAFELAVFIGRFQPFHMGHKIVVERALAQAKQVLLLVGSSFEPPSLRNPWSFEEREDMIRACFSAEENKRLFFKPLLDIRYNDTLWTAQVQRAVYEFSDHDDADITLIGLSKNGAGYYTSLFPQWQSTPVLHDVAVEGVQLRDYLFSNRPIDPMAAVLAPQIVTALKAFMQTPQGQNLLHEHEFIQRYKKGWEAAPFEPTHVTVDAVVVQSGHVLLVKRGAQPGKGLYALPGGFIQPDELLLHAVVRKIKEETQLKVPVPVLMGSVKSQRVFDAPFRSARGRTITHAFHIELRAEESLPKVKGGGETSKCFWLPLGKLDSRTLFEDHYFIIQTLLGTL